MRIPHTLTPILELLYPPSCLSCDTRLPRSDAGWLCGPCQQTIRYITPPYCVTCGRSADASATICDHCRRLAPTYTHGFVAYQYRDAMRDCLHAVKFRQHRPLGQWLGDQLGAVAAQHLRRTDYDMIIPVPLHRARTRDRGFNQSALLAYRIGAAIELPVATRALRRIGPATEQHLLGTAQRLRNMHTFQAATRSLGGQRILLVDDILTTGATANACTRALYNAGATSVDFIALASN